MSKYNAKKCEYKGYKFDSIVEKERYVYLKSLEDRKEIFDLEVHPKFILQNSFNIGNEKYLKIDYEADFSYNYNNILIVEDIKGLPTEGAKLKRKMFLYKYCKDSNIILKWIVKAPKYTKLEWIDYFELNKIRKERKKSDIK